jgi:hypothetical protein
MCKPAGDGAVHANVGAVATHDEVWPEIGNSHGERTGDTLGINVRHVRFDRDLKHAVDPYRKAFAKREHRRGAAARDGGHMSRDPCALSETNGIVHGT